MIKHEDIDINTNACYSANGEDYDDDIGSTIDSLLGDCSSVEQAMQSTISVGDSVRPNVKGSYLAEWLVERISEDLYDEVGEYSENYEASKSDYDELTAFLTQWIDKQDFRCYSVINVKEVPLTDFMEVTEIVEYFK